MDFVQFLVGISSELEELRHDPQRFSAVRLSQLTTANEVIAVGVGRQGERGGQLAKGEFPVALNNKAPWGDHWDLVCTSSVTRFVLGAPEPVLDTWREALGFPGDRPVALSALKLGVEDASPDSCFGLLIFLALISGVAREAIPARWIAHVDAWERGFTSKELSPISYGDLHNPLVHAHVKDDIRAAWIDGLALLVACLKTGVDPESVDVQARDTTIVRAIAVLRYERSNYRNVRDSLPRLQLELPLAAVPDRKMMVDAVISEERLLFGSSKVDLRADREHSFLGQGYTLYALHRPDEAGEGGDMTVSLDPSSGLSLLDLWRALEHEEDEKWGSDRPNDDPDRRLASYPGGYRTDDLGRATDIRSPNQPWFHFPDFSLVGAPKRLKGGELGSKLAWGEVLDKVWALYNPFRNIRIVATVGNMSLNRGPSEDELCAIGDCPNEALHSSSRRVLKCGRWHRPNNATPALRWTPTLGRYLASCLKVGMGRAAEPRLADILDAPAHDRLLFPAGIAVVSEDGAFVLANDVGPDLKVAEFRAVFEVAAEVMDWVDGNTARVSELVSAVRRHMAGEHVDKLDSHLTIYNEICALQLTIVELRHKLDTRTTDRPSLDFRNAIIAGWGIEGRLDTLYRDLEEAKAILTAHSELVTNRRIAFLTYFGFPIVLAASLFSFIFSAIPRSPIGFSGINWAGLLAGIHWTGLIGFGIFAVIGVLIMLALMKTGDRFSRISLRSVRSAPGTPPQSAGE